MVRFIPHRGSFAAAGLVLAIALCLHGIARAADDAVLPGPRVLFVVSGGAWQESASEGSKAAPDDTTPEESGPEESGSGEAGSNAAAERHGYYRLSALRRADNTTRFVLQMMALGDSGPEAIETTEIKTLNELKAFATDLRADPAKSDSPAPGFSAFVSLKTAPDRTQTEEWTIFVDEFGELKVESSTN